MANEDCGACCAHLNVKFRRLVDGPDLWLCAECGMHFRPSAGADLQIKTLKAEITQLNNDRQQHIALQEFVLRKHADIFKTLDAEIERLKAAFDEHIRHTGSFLNELFAVMVDPVYEGPAIDVKEMCQQLKDAALRDREAAHDHADAICAMYREIESLTAEHAKALAEAERAQLERDCAAVCHDCAVGVPLVDRSESGQWRHVNSTVGCRAWELREADYQRGEREKGAGNASRS